ncbi:acyltransferase family protein [Lacticaseibacillus thailandensis]|uniref:acyltransferase family protein n=1 Tax=Lacticaseibacillus thailandensis TaxID=381741 RepID=UPI000AC20C4A|nr:acyltransferase [Lacticaseibacillus thailandensis]
MANSTTQTASQPPKKKRVYLYEVDLMRVIFIFGVLANHATSTVTTPMTAQSGPWYIMLGTHLILHFTRMGFMFVSGLVLFLGHYNKNRNWPQFWYKRYKGSGIPYLVWNGVFLLDTAWVTGAAITPSSWFHQWIDAVLHADQFYMYYLLVMFQLYLIFPILVWFLHKLGSLRNHLILLVISGGIQLAFLAWAKYVFPYISHAGWPYMFANYGNFIGSYQSTSSAAPSRPFTTNRWSSFCKVVLSGFTASLRCWPSGPLACSTSTCLSSSSTGTTLN